MSLLLPLPEVLVLWFSPLHGPSQALQRSPPSWRGPGPDSFSTLRLTVRPRAPGLWVQLCHCTSARPCLGPVAAQSVQGRQGWGPTLPRAHRVLLGRAPWPLARGLSFHSENPPPLSWWGLICSRSSLKVSIKRPGCNCTIIFRFLTDGTVLALPLGTLPVSRECSIIIVTASALKCSRMWARMELAHFEESWISFFLI